MMKVHGTARRLFGTAFHLIVSGLIGRIHAWGFQLVSVQDNLWLWGLLRGAIHWVLARLFLIMVPVMHPEIPEERGAPGAFAKNCGTNDVDGFFMGHLVYGVTVGVLSAWFHSGGGIDRAF